ncbi:MAG: efflux RND transporter permease subunit [Campylobacteraceae bacterium]
MIARFFVNRPVFAWVISLIIMIAGGISIQNLAVEQYPDIAPPTIQISTSYSGASAEAVENSVIQIIEQQLTGINGLLYFSSSSSSSGRARIRATFIQGTDPDIAQVQVNNKVQQILSKLPSDVQRQGVTVAKTQTDFLLLASIYDESDTRDGIDVADYLVSNLQDQISRIDGVGEVQVFGGQYAMRIWLDPKKLESYNLMPSDVKSAINTQNSQASAGSVGALPSIDDQQLNFIAVSRSKYKTVKEFEDIIIKNSIDGSEVTIKDIARVEIGSESYTSINSLNGHPSSGIAVQLAPGANAITTANKIKALLAQYEPTLPDGFKIAYPRDSTLFIEASIHEIVKTLFEAILLVIIVMYIFLKSWRATIIPAITIPIVLLGTFAILNILGFSINTLTMFGMVLAIGLLVDDAIVVVENVERNMREKNLPPKEATILAMEEITGALIGVATVLSIVFLPMAFFAGSTGIIYRQFSATIISSMVLSVIIALTLSPALCATILKPYSLTSKKKSFITWFNEKFEQLTKKYSKIVAIFIANPIKCMATYIGIIILLAFVFVKLPTSFLPKEDQGLIMVQFTLPPGATASRSVDVANIIKDYFLNEEKNNTQAIFTSSGYRFGGTSQNGGTGFISLVNWNQRPGVANEADSIAKRATHAFNDSTSKYFVRDAKVITMSPPVVRGLGQTDGFHFELQATAGLTRDDLRVVRDKIMEEAKQSPSIKSIRADELEAIPQLRISYDKKKIYTFGLNLDEIDNTLSSAWAGTYVNDFIDRSRIKKVYIQGDAPFRSKPDDLYTWSVRNSNGTMTSFKEFSKINYEYGEIELSRYNGLISYGIQGSAAFGVSSGIAMDTMDMIANKHSNGTIHSWSDLSYQERMAGGQSGYLYILSLVVIFLCLAALYESWSIPISVLMVVPLGVIGAVLAIYFRGLNNDIYFQVALLTTVGLASKNAILIVEFIEDAHKKGRPLIESAIEGATLRFRPIIMTSLAFIAGVIPLAISSGVGANSKIAIGTGIVGGTFTAMVLAIFFVPLFFVLVKKLFSKNKKISGE